MQLLQIYAIIAPMKCIFCTSFRVVYFQLYYRHSAISDSMSSGHHLF